VPDDKTAQTHALQMTLFFHPFPSGKGGTYEVYLESEGCMSQVSCSNLGEAQKLLLKTTKSWAQHNHKDFQEEDFFKS